ncbi:MAG: NAD(P) transhydrogenase subunit alpha [Proteobacteria bacterium]|nr:NAD(P) transhydrogenase subunit alpha [Pseudomonadota bacterium]
MQAHLLLDQVSKVQEALKEVTQETIRLESVAKEVVQKIGTTPQDPFVMALTVFVLACFVGYYVVWKVTPALHSPLMSVTNAISSVIIVGALIAAGPALAGISTTFGFLAVILASINIFGGFIVTQRMLSMFSKSK